MFGNIVNLFDIYCFSEVPFLFSLGLLLEPAALPQLGDRTCPVSLWTLRAQKRPSSPSASTYMHIHPPPDKPTPSQAAWSLLGLGTAACPLAQAPCHLAHGEVWQGRRQPWLRSCTVRKQGLLSS
uniref:Uncharacterized protein n=1 Tax=Pipistrellus kuhlii TaxID=59472 RepID=A0A7J7XW78_PIPKU|nr:hypothetical protein mPipKuh1_010503 [Pipistrellus kuhlii]